MELRSMSSVMSRTKRRAEARTSLIPSKNERTLQFLPNSQHPQQRYISIRSGITTLITTLRETVFNDVIHVHTCVSRNFDSIIGLEKGLPCYLITSINFYQNIFFTLNFCDCKLKPQPGR